MKLRERMQHLEKELAEARKRDADYRLMLEQRLARVETECAQKRVEPSCSSHSTVTVDCSLF